MKYFKLYLHGKVQIYASSNYTVEQPILKFLLYVITRQSIKFLFSKVTYHKIRIRVYHYKILKCIIFHRYLLLLILSNKQNHAQDKRYQTIILLQFFTNIKQVINCYTFINRCILSQIDIKFLKKLIILLGSV